MRVRIVALLVLMVLSGCGPVMTVQVVNGPSSAATTGGSATSEQQAASSPAPETAAGEACARIPGSCSTEMLLSTIVTYLTFLAELCGALVIAVAVLRALLRFIPHIFKRQESDDTYKEDIRLTLGKSLALALEFELGADILKTAVAPTLAIIAQLAAIALLRTFLNYFLEQELRRAEERRAHVQTTGDPRSSTDQVHA